MSEKSVGELFVDYFDAMNTLKRRLGIGVEFVDHRDAWWMTRGQTLLISTGDRATFNENAVDAEFMFIRDEIFRAGAGLIAIRGYARGMIQAIMILTADKEIKSD